MLSHPWCFNPPGGSSDPLDDTAIVYDVAIFE